MTNTDPKTWFITGVSTGLGLTLAQCALERGDRVVGTVRQEKDRAAFDALSSSRAFGVLLDVTDTEAVRRVIAEAEAKTGGIDILVNNAGYGLTAAIEEATLDEVRAQFEVNVFGATAIIQAALPFMRARKAGHIVNITSVSGLATWEGTGFYCASKFALEAIGQTLAAEVAPLGIKVTNVEPGGLRTDFTGRSMAHTKTQIPDYAPTAHQTKKIIRDHAGQEPGDPKKAAQAIITAVLADTPPMHLLLGADAMHYAGHHMAALQMEMADWAPVTLSIGCAEEES